MLNSSIGQLLRCRRNPDLVEAEVSNERDRVRLIRGQVVQHFSDHSFEAVVAATALALQTPIRSNSK